MRDEIQTGNIAIDGAKNFGRFEAFFLPSAQWEQVREAFWARTGFPVDPAAAVEQLKARLSDAFDRFLEGVPDNRQVVFDDDGWRLKTDPAEHPDRGSDSNGAKSHVKGRCWDRLASQDLSPSVSQGTIRRYVAVDGRLGYA